MYAKMAFKMLLADFDCPRADGGWRWTWGRVFIHVCMCVCACVCVMPVAIDRDSKRRDEAGWQLIVPLLLL